MHNDRGLPISEERVAQFREPLSNKGKMVLELMLNGA